MKGEREWRSWREGEREEVQEKEGEKALQGDNA